MCKDTLNVQPLRYIAVEHLSNQIDAFITHGPGNAQVAIHDFVDIVEWVLLVDDGIEQDAESPDILLFPAVGPASQDFGGGIIYVARVLA